MSHHHNRRNRTGGGLYWRSAEGFTHEWANRKMEDSEDRWLEKASWCEKDRVHKQPSVVVFLTIMWVRNGGSSDPFLFFSFYSFLLISFHFSYILLHILIFGSSVFSSVKQDFHILFMQQYKNQKWSQSASEMTTYTKYRQ